MPAMRLPSTRPLWPPAWPAAPRRCSTLPPRIASVRCRPWRAEGTSLRGSRTGIALLAACCVAQAAASDAGEAPSSYAQALQQWRTPEELSAWAAQHFRYDTARAVLLSDTQRRLSMATVAEPAAFFDAPRGVCVDLSRFAVETLRRIAPQAEARYLMIEFEALQLQGQTLRLHWIASFRRGGSLYFLADSERPGHVAGPYASASAFVEDYAAYRGRPVVRFAELDSFQRKVRTLTRAATPSP